MKRIIIIDACSANITFTGTADTFPAPARATMYGRLLQSAILLGEAARNVCIMGEAGRDALGYRLVARLEKAGVDVAGIDRYSDGASTPSTLIFPAENPDGSFSAIPYRSGLTENWDCIWPRVDATDVVVFGGYFSLQKRVRPRLCEFLAQAHERGALLVYLPGYNVQLEPVVTRVMPYILENLEMSDAVITSTSDLCNLFGTDNPRGCYDSKISFYAPLMINTDSARATLTLMQGGRTIERVMGVADGSLVPSALQPALFVDALQRNGVKPTDCASLPVATLEAIADATAQAEFPI